MGMGINSRDFYYRVGDGWQKIDRVKEIPPIEECPDTVETSTIGEMTEFTFSCELNKKSLRQLRWLAFKACIKDAFKILFGK